MRFRSFAVETIFASTAYIIAFFLTFEALMPVQNLIFSDFVSNASLLFLPHGVRVIAAWLLGFRSIVALLPGVFITYAYVAGSNVFLPSRLAGIAIAVLAAPLLFEIAARLRHDIRPAKGVDPCWPCVMGLGIVAAIVGGTLTNLVFASPPLDYLAYFIGDIAGLFFLMLLMMLGFRFLRSRHQ